MEQELVLEAPKQRAQLVNGQDHELESLRSFSGTSSHKSVQIATKNLFSRFVEPAVEYPPLAISAYD